jgi:hypothetical protein
LISDSDIDAIMRRMDSDGDDEISFSDLFTNLLPYLIYGETKQAPTNNELASRSRKHRNNSENKSLLNIKMDNGRPISNKLKQRSPNKPAKTNFERPDSILEPFQ